jgi:hypothetical protein
VWSLPGRVQNIYSILHLNHASIFNLINHSITFPEMHHRGE